MAIRRYGFIAFLLAIVWTAQAQTLSAKVLTWTCHYPRIANANGARDGQSLELTFNLDDTTRKAKVTTDAGVRNVEVITGEDGLTFLDALRSGAVNVTTIDTSGKSVHTRHTLLRGLLVPSQSYGSCRHE
jgi:hypothetical protein